MAQRGTLQRMTDYDRLPPDLDAAERETAAAEFAHQRVMRVGLPDGRTALCETMADVKAVQAGRIPRNAVRLDRAPTA